MANDFSGLTKPILVRGLAALRTRCAAPRLVNTSYSQDAKQRGNTIQIPAYQTAVATDVTPSATPFAAPDTTVGMVNLTLDKWKKSALVLTDRDKWAFENGGESPAVNACADAIAAAIHQSVIDTYTSFYGVVGTAGTTPFGTPGLADAVNLNKMLTIQQAPTQGRTVMLDPTAAAAARMLPAFHNAQYGSQSTTASTGKLGNILGMDWQEVHTVPTHTAGTGTGYLVNGASVTAGLTTIPVDTGSGTLVKGDIITFAGHTQTYTVTANYAGGAGNITISPALRVAVADNAAITKLASATVNLGFTRDAIAFASRRELPSMDPSVIFDSLVDDDPENGTGIALNIEFERQHKQDLIMVSCIWGVVVARPEFGVRLLG
jgi:hypothetical protein